MSYILRRYYKANCACRSMDTIQESITFIKSRDIFNIGPVKCDEKETGG